jgi:hypothetical protein
VSEPTIGETSLGAVEVEFGINRWVMVTTRSGTEQAQVASRGELEDHLRELGLVGREAQDLARQAWAARPRDADIQAASAGESAMRATGFSRGTVLVLIIAFVVAVVLISYYAASHWPDS